MDTVFARDRFEPSEGFETRLARNLVGGDGPGLVSALPVRIEDRRLDGDKLRIEATLGDGRVVTVPTPVMGGEDFSFYAQRVPAVFFCLGLKPAGKDKIPTLHQPDFDFNDDALPTGIEMFCRLATASA